MIITRRKKIPLHWAFYAQLPLLLSIYGNFAINAPFLLVIKKFIDNPAAIMGLISIEVYVTLIGGPVISWLSDRIWTRFGRRKFFLVIADALSGVILIAMPFAPSLITLIVLRWLYGAVRDFGNPTQALAYEIVPPPQRGRSAGFFSAMINFGNLVFFFLVLGRFDDAYFMGPFSFFTEVTGGVLMFGLAATLLIGIAIFEALGFKEIEPHDRKTLDSDRRAGEGSFRHYVKSFFKDIFAWDLAPIYMLLIVDIMFGVGLGIFQPLLFTEQWGYSLQDMGNTVAVGVIFAVTLSLVSGWFADKFGKMNAFIVANAGSLLMGVFYTLYVYYQPDQRPSLTEIIVIGNVGLVFSMLKAVVGFPLAMEYVRRNRMGAAIAGRSLFGNLLRNSIALFVGVWLAWWSYWFYPQAGYYVEATMIDQLDDKMLRETLEAGGVETGDLKTRPLHQYGIDGERSMRWWIHREDERAHELLGEKKDLDNELSRLRGSASSPFNTPDETAAIEADIAAARERADAIDAELAERTEELRAELEPVLAEVRFNAGTQVRDASVDGEEVSLTLTSIERLVPENTEQLARLLEGPEHRLIPDETDDAFSPYRADIEIVPLEGDPPGFTTTVRLDARFVDFYRAAVEAGVEPRRAYAASTVFTSIARGILGRTPGLFDIDAGFDGGMTIRLTTDQPQEAVEPVAEALEADNIFSNVSLADADGGFILTGDVDFAGIRVSPEPYADEVARRFGDFVSDPGDVGLLVRAYERTAGAAAQRPTYLTVPTATLASGYREREYEYFFSSQTLMIATDLLGFVLVGLLIVMERRGLVRRHGVEEDLAR